MRAGCSLSAVAVAAAVRAQSLARLRELALCRRRRRARARAARGRRSCRAGGRDPGDASCRPGPRRRPDPCWRRRRRRSRRSSTPRARPSEPGGERRRIEQEPIWDWASRNLSAASERLLSPADRIERAVAPWSAYVILPLFAFSATGVRLTTSISRRPTRGASSLGVVLGLVVGKPLGIVARVLARRQGAAGARCPTTSRCASSSARPACAASATRSRC